MKKALSNAVKRKSSSPLFLPDFPSFCYNLQFQRPVFIDNKGALLYHDKDHIDMFGGSADVE